MPNPIYPSTHIDRPLTMISVAYQQAAENFIADAFCPIVPVQKQSDLYFEYSKADWNRLEVQERAPNTESAGGGYRLSTASYFARRWAIHKDIARQDLENADEPLNLLREATEYTAYQMLLNRENQLVSRFFQASIWTGSASGADQTGVAASPQANEFLQWNDQASQPVEDIARLSVEMVEKTGRRPNTLVLGPKVYVALKNHPDILDRIKYTQRGVVTQDILASVFDMERVLVPWSARNTAEEGAAASMSFFFGKAALLAYVAPTPGLMQPSAGYTFAWTGFDGAGAYGVAVKQFPVPLIDAQRVEAENFFDMKRVASDLGIFFASAVA